MMWGIRFFYDDETHSTINTELTLLRCIERIKQEEYTSKKRIISIVTWDMESPITV